MVCIIDDREDVWSHAANLIHVKPYHFFQHTGDINAPPGLDKHEDDDKEGVDLTKVAKPDGPGEKSENAETKDENLTTVNEGKIDKSPSEGSSEKVDGKSVDLTGSKICDDLGSKDADVSSESGPPSRLTEESNVELKTVPGDELVTKVTELSASIEEAKINLEETTDKKSEPGTTPKTDTLTTNGKLKEIAPVPIDKLQDPNLYEVEDPDDYINYLEDILKQIHRSYYQLYDEMESGKIPDLKTVIPCK